MTIGKDYMHEHGPEEYGAWERAVKPFEDRIDQLKCREFGSDGEKGEK